MLTCSECTSKKTVKNGRIHTGKQRFLCKRCGR
ncbi:MAG: IS1/IS1595 family N-terminal zinc-binding domain-containing protein [Elainellaceae cyanobacterium]